jgi:hypothetical protein
MICIALLDLFRQTWHQAIMIETKIALMVILIGLRHHDARVTRPLLVFLE